MWNSLIAKTKDLLFPVPCVGCGMDRKGYGECLCSLCHMGIRCIENPFCYVCGYPVDLDYKVDEEKIKCGLCRKETFSFDQARSFGFYESILKELIHYYKYNYQLGALKDIEDLLNNYFQIRKTTYSSFKVIPVPLHVKKLYSRGFDQSYLLAKSIARILQIPFLGVPVVRIKNTPPQVKIKRKERMRNIKGAFKIENPDTIKNQDLLIVDDVFTTGSTTNELAKILKKNGAGKVYVFTLARAL